MSIQIDNVDDLINVGTPASLNNMASISASVWVNMPAYTGSSSAGRIIDKYTGTSNGWRWYISGSTIEFDVAYQVGATVFFRESVAASFPLNTWQNLSFTWDGGSGTAGCHLYVNATEVTYFSSVAGSGARDNDSALPLTIGNRNDGARVFNGKLAELAIFNSVIAASDLVYLANSSQIRGVAGRPLLIASCQGYWPLQDYADGSTANTRQYTDKSANASHGTGNWGANGSGLVSSVEQGYMAGGGMWGF